MVFESDRALAAYMRMFFWYCHISLLMFFDVSVCHLLALGVRKLLTTSLITTLNLELVFY